MFCYEERPLNRKEKASSFYFARDIGEKGGNKQNQNLSIEGDRSLHSMRDSNFKTSTLRLENWNFFFSERQILEPGII